MRTVRRAALLACALLIASCTGGSEVIQPATPVATEAVVTETPSVVAEPIATSTPEPALISDDRIAAAVAAFEADPRPTELIAYDYLEPLVSTNQIRLTVCGWTGETVFDDVYQITYRVGQTLNDDGEIDVAFESVNTTLDTCTNTELIETALQATRDFDNYWTGVASEPTTFDEDQASAILAQEFIDFSKDIIDSWVNDGLSYRNGFLDGGIPESAVTEPLTRSYLQDEFEAPTPNSSKPPSKPPATTTSTGAASLKTRQVSTKPKLCSPCLQNSLRLGNRRSLLGKMAAWPTETATSTASYPVLR